jgi:hypothetical protein
MKKRGFIKNKVVECIAKMSVEKAALIPFTHVSQSSFEINSYWIVMNQHLANVEYKMKYPFIKYSGCTCEWAIQKNFCKHQIILIFMVTDVTQEDVIDYCGTWFGSYHEGLATMFVDPKYILDDSNFEDDGETNGDEGVIDIGLMEPWKRLCFLQMKLGLLMN